MSAFYASALQNMVTAQFDWTSGTYKILLVSSGYAPNFATHTTLADIPGGNRLNTPLALSTLVASGGVCRADALSLPALTVTAPIAGIVILKDIGGASSTWPLICYLDQGAGFGEQPTATDVYIVWDTNGIFLP